MAAADPRPVKWTPPDKRLIIVTTEGRIIGPIRNDSRVIRNFMGQSDNTGQPEKKRYGRIELLGPFEVRDGEDRYQLYLIRPRTPHSLILSTS